MIMEKLSNFFSKFKAEDDEKLQGLLQEEYWFFVYISGLYHNASKPLQTVIVMSVHTFTLLFHSIAFAVTGVYVFPDVFSIGEYIQYSVLSLTSLIVFFGLRMKRRSFEESQRFALYGLYDYGPSCAIDKEKLLAPVAKKLRVYKIFYPLACLMIFTLIFLAVPLLDYITGYRKVFDPAIQASALIPVWIPPGLRVILPAFVISFFEMVCGVSVSLTSIGGCLIYLQLTASVSVELTLLKLSIQDLRGRAARLYLNQFGKEHSDTSSRAYERCLYFCFRQNIIHYQRILRGFNSIQETVSVGVFQFFVASALLFSTAGLGILSEESRIGIQVKSSIIFITEVLILAVMCWAGEEIRSLCSEVRVVLYEFDWYQTSMRFKKSFILMQLSTLKPMTVTGAGMVSADRDTFATIMNTSFSYCNLLLASRG